MKNIKVIELFAGVGGFRLGLENSNKTSDSKYEIVWSNQWEPSTKVQHASDIYEKNFETGCHINEDITKIDTKDIPNFDMLCGGFPCFVAGTLVLTDTGYKKIEDIVIGDKVLTHKNRYKKVLAPMNQDVNQIAKVKIYGSPEFYSTTSHPFRTIKRIEYYENRERKYRFEEEKWTDVKDLIPIENYVGINVNQVEKLYSFTYQDLSKQGKIDFDRRNLKRELKTELPLHSEIFWWFIGRYLADGGFQLKKYKGSFFYQTYLVGNKKEEKEIEDKLKILGIEYKKREQKTVIRFDFQNIILTEFVSKLGKYSHNKQIPIEIQNLPIYLLKYFIEGYRSGDGYIDKNANELHRITTTSEALAYGYQNIIHKVYKLPCRISLCKKPKTCVIEGRTVNQRNTYSIHYRLFETREKTIYKNKKIWVQVKKVEINNEIRRVYNIEVQDDNSYNIQNLVCKNCQDYSVAKPKNRSEGLEGKKGVLYWDILRIVEKQKNDYIFLENVDRLISSPSKQRGRDFAVIIKTLMDLDYLVEWRVVNAAEYGMPQKRRRTYIFAYKKNSKLYKKIVGKKDIDTKTFLSKKSLFAQSFPIQDLSEEKITEVNLTTEVFNISDNFNKEGEYKKPFMNSGYAIDGMSYTVKSKPEYNGKYLNIEDILIPEKDIEEEFYIKEEDVERWRDPKTAKSIPKVNKKTGIAYTYKQGAMNFPEPLNGPSRTIITSEGGKSPSRTTHVIKVGKRYRRLHPIELERLNMFPDNHTEGVTASKRAFLMGNALVIGVVEKVGEVLMKNIS